MEESVKMKQFNHPNVMSLIGVCTDADPAPYIIMPHSLWIQQLSLQVLSIRTPEY